MPARVYRPSFRQLLLAAFLLISGLLAAASLGGLLTLERLAAQSRAAAQHAGELNAAVQHIGERRIEMERAARQFLVLEDPGLRQRFVDAASEAQTLLRQIEQQLPPPGAQALAWRARLALIRARLDQAPPRGAARLLEAELTADFRDLEALTAALAEQVRLASEARNAELQARLESGRARVGQQVLAAIVLALAASLAFGIWLTRPLRRLEQAIVDLGENRLDRSVDIRGPSDLRSLGRRLDWLRLRLSELDADKARFLRHVSHELKTPLAALREGVALLEDGVAGALSADQREIARILSQNTAALQRQIEDLLRFNAAAFEARQLQRRPTELAALIRGKVDEQRLQWQARQLLIEIDGGPLVADVDPDKLATALGNLLSNAIRFSPQRGGIRFLLSTQPGHIDIDICDQGPGIAASDRARIFEPFYRGERQPEDALRGSGIGLSIVQEYVAAHGGRIALLPSSLGAHFRITLLHASVA
ncbi:sensor histidine kinase [Roseateles violae]|uniref:histidine kinase n=1 Tax=Roseateles violae TaxID=3058042 RepID=A0ABT8DL80_9BURK|nr:HAMP domain-containing sensor histidine kinase [Pelomonas sp. PFR6]MDN3918653.1 HAMP domain-containing sensor histidine kinase [Pelomonas sp. PFR6]